MRRKHKKKWRIFWGFRKVIYLYYRSDDHTIPGLGKMDWNEITKALGEIDYTGDFTYEADTFLETLAAPFRYSALKFMAEIGRQLISDIDKARAL